MDYKDLNVWILAMALVIKIYDATKKFPQEERYGLIDQMRRSSVSIPSNIAEGHARRTPKDFTKFLRIALGSVAELETQTIVAHSLNYIDKQTEEDLKNDCLSLQKMLRKFIKSITAQQPSNLVTQ
ncbi:MAG: four helix bundle protein [Candidatus Paceibacterota bacterium]